VAVINTSLLAFAAERPEPVTVDRYLPPARPTAANSPYAAAATQDRIDRQLGGLTDGRTPYRYIEPAAYYATSVNNKASVLENR